MSITIDDGLVRATGLSDQQLRLEIACRLYAAEFWSRQDACKFAGLTDPFEFDRELAKRKLSAYTAKRFDEETESLKKLHLLEPDDQQKPDKPT